MRAVTNMDNKCPQLVEWSGGIILMCKEGKTAHVPDLSEINAYCKTKAYSKCHFYMQSSNVTPAVKKINKNIKKKYEICNK